MAEFLKFLESHAGIILLCVIGFLVVEAIVRIAMYGKNKNNRSNKIDKGNKTLVSALMNDGVDGLVLVENKTKLPVNVSDNIERFVGVDKESVYADLSLIYKGFSSVDKENLIEKLKAWDRQDKLTFEAYWNPDSEEKKYYQIMVMSVNEGQHSLFVVRDITQEKEKRDALQLEVKEARKSEESKTIFLSNMSHEIRTPLNGMLGMIGLAKMNIGEPEDVTECLDKAEELSKFLLSVINDILDMSRIESGKTQLEEVSFDMRGTVRKLENMFRGTITEKGINFKTEFIDVTNPYVIGDELRITQVITNFLSNSSKFTPKGGEISLTVKQMGIIDGRSSWMFRVKDTGKGMTQEFLHKIFKPFEQEDSGIVRKFGGSGLGMAIADNMVKLMGGQILVESELGQGSTFTVFVRLQEADASTVEVEEHKLKNTDAISLEGRKILLAEDHKINATIVVRMLATQGAEVETAENGLIAFEKFKDSEVGYYDVILMDIQMPEMDGWQATSKIRALDREDAKNIPIFALSADAFVEDKRKSAETGMNGHVTKPIDFKELIKTLKGALSKRV